MDCPTHARQREGHDDGWGGLGGNWDLEKNMNLGEAHTQDRGVEKIGFCFNWFWRWMFQSFKFVPLKQEVYTCHVQ